MNTCLYPRTIKTSSSDGRQVYVIDRVPCGHCPNCLANRRDDWCIRLKEEVKAAFTAWAITLTYDQEHNDGKLHKEHPQKWIRAIRDYFGHDKSIRYFIAGEYGDESLRPHYHCLVFNVPWSSFVLCKEDALKFWPYCGEEGCKVDLIDNATIRYVSKYVLKRYDLEMLGLPYMRPLMSKGIGKAYLSDDRKIYHRESLNNFIIQDGYKSSLPRYYRNRLFDSSMMEEVTDRMLPKYRFKERANALKDLDFQGWTRLRLPKSEVSDGHGSCVHSWRSEVSVPDYSTYNPDKDYRQLLAEQVARRIEKVKKLNNIL